MNRFLSRSLPVIDCVVAPFVYPCAWLLKQVRQAGVDRLPNCKRVLMKVGVFPIRNHYYEPKFDYGYPKPLETERTLPGIDWNVPGQMDLLSRFNFAHELVDIPLHKPSGISFYMNNAAFIAGDAEYWYQLIRHLKPKRIFEVGSGNSTLMAIRAIQKNRECDPMYNCKLVCIEPYENPWLEDLDVKIVRKRIEDIELSFFAELEENDILFVDSSHVIRPGGDVLFEFLELFPRLKKGVIVHLHDIFSPRDYPKQWVENELRFWNEQYLLEAFLSGNHEWKVIGAVNFLRHHCYEELKKVAPFLTPSGEPGSLYLQKVA